MSTPATSGTPQHTSVSPLTPVITHTTRSTPDTRIMNPMDESFGYTLSTSRSHESRHDRRQSIADIPPPYSEESSIPLPEYTLHAPEPKTLAMYLFKFGFCMFLSSHSHARIYPDQSLTQYSHHSGFLVPLSLCRLCVNHPPTQLTRCPHGCPRKQKMSGRKSSPHCAKLSSNGRNGAYVPSSSLQSSLYLAALLAGQSCAVNSNLPSHSWTAFFITTSSHHNHELYNQQNFAFIYTLRTFIPLTIC